MMPRLSGTLLQRQCCVSVVVFLLEKLHLEKYNKYFKYGELLVYPDLILLAFQLRVEVVGCVSSSLDHVP